MAEGANEFQGMRIDAHQHFWKYDAAEYPWIREEWGSLRRDFLPSDLEKELDGANLDGSVAVQARQTWEETEWLLSLAEAAPRIKGVVGWADLRSPSAEEQLAVIAGHPKGAGVRHVVQDEPDDRFLLQPAFMRGIGALKQFDLVYDLLLYPRQLPAAIELARRFPEQPFVLDHLSKPEIRAGTLRPWKEWIRELARSENVSCKLSGMVTEAKAPGWQPSDFAPYLETVFEAFGADRLLFGSDWPVCVLGGSYAEVFRIVDGYFGIGSEETRRKIFGANAAAIYGL